METESFIISCRLLTKSALGKLKINANNLLLKREYFRKNSQKVSSYDTSIRGAIFSVGVMLNSSKLQTVIS